MKSSNKGKRLLSAMYVAGVLCAMVFIVTKSEVLMYKATATMFDDGSLNVLRSSNRTTESRQ